MLNYSVSYFLPEFWSQAPLYAEKIIPLLDNMLSNNFNQNEKLSSAFYELINKYQNTADLPVENIKEYIKENGYSYITDLLESDANLKIVLYLLPLIHFLKGSEAGLKIVLSLFKLADSSDTIDDTIITQWYNALPVGEENTFSVDLPLDITKVSNKFYTNFSNFIKHYVYPELRELKVRYRLEATKVQMPYTSVKIACDSVVEMSV